jgi:hypothetical protein
VDREIDETRRPKVAVKGVRSRTYWYKLPVAEAENLVMPDETIGDGHATNCELLVRWWQKAKNSDGQVVLISSERVSANRLLLEQ